MLVSISSAFSMSILTCSMTMKVMSSSRSLFSKVCRNSAIGFGSLMVTSTNFSLFIFSFTFYIYLLDIQVVFIGYSYI